VQDNAPTVEGALEEILEQTLGNRVIVEGSGRTDSGVHALGQVAHFDTDNQSIPAKAFPFILNSKLPHGIRVMECHEADGRFHARFTAMAREYKYFVKEADQMFPFDAGYVKMVRHFPPLELLQSYAGLIFGTHDFTTFTASGDLCPSKWRDIYASDWRIEKDRFGSDVLIYTICGNAFLYHMVRSLVGTQLEFAAKGLSAEQFAAVLHAKERCQCGRTAEACGLYLNRISYDPEEYAWFEEDERWKKGKENGEE
jgi:tRNA pseudouridine38-40 synthase